MIAVLKFIGYLVAPLFAPVAIVVLGIAWLILAIGLGLLNTWYRATGDSRYEFGGMT